MTGRPFQRGDVVRGRDPRSPLFMIVTPERPAEGFVEDPDRGPMFKRIVGKRRVQTFGPEPTEAVRASGAGPVVGVINPDDFDLVLRVGGWG